MNTIEVGQLAQKREQGAIELIDVRTPVEYREIHAGGARNVPLNTVAFKQWSDQQQSTGPDPIYVICKGGSRSAQACQLLIAAGVTHAVSVDGGTSAWQQAGLPVVRGKKAISLERQVRMVAGFLALLGAVLGYFVHPSLVGISGFIGAGLLFAGITDTCGMGMMLAKMPWNQCAASEACSVS